MTLRSPLRLAVFGGTALALAVACGGGGDDKKPIDAAALCGGTLEVAGTVQSDQLVEISGLASSRHQDVIWAHNDSGDTPRVFALGTGGNHLQTYTLSDAEAIDWEDMALGPGPDEGVDYLYLADIGDNAAQRPEVYVYRVPEPEVDTQADTPTENQLDDVEKLTLRYPDRAHDAETLLVDPTTGDLVIVTKELQGPEAYVFRAPASTGPDAPQTLEEAGRVDFRTLPMQVEIPPDAPALVAGLPYIPTGGDASPDGRLIAIRTYGTVWVFTRPEGTSLAEALLGVPCEGPSAIETQGEALAFDADGRGYVTISEAAPDATVLPVNHVRSLDGVATD